MLIMIFLFSRIRILQKHLRVQYDISNAYVGTCKFFPLPLAAKYFDLQHVILFLRREKLMAGLLQKAQRPTFCTTSNTMLINITN